VRRSGPRTRRTPPSTPAGLSRTAAPGPPRRFTPVAIALVVLWAVLFAPQLVAHRGFVIGDAADLRAYAEYSAARWQSVHQRTFWTPFLFAGLPATASLADFRPQFLPDPLLTAWDAAHRLPFWPPLLIPLLVHLAGMLAAARLAWRLWDAGPAASAWAGATFGLAPNLIVPFTFGHDPQLMAVSLLPVVMLGAHEVMAAERPAAPARGLAAGVAFMLLAQYPQIVTFAVPLTAAFAIERAITLRRPARLAWIAAALALGALMSSVSWWPAMLYNRQSIRGAAGGIGLEEVAQYSLALHDLATLAWPWAVGYGAETYWGGMRATDFPQYLGAATLVLALIGLRGAAPGRALTARFFAAAAVIAAVTALGTHLGAAYVALHRYAPLWSSFRLPVNALIVTQLAVALLAARGFERAWREARARTVWRSPSTRIALAAALLMLVVGALVLGPGRETYARAARASRPAMSDGAAAALAGQAGGDLAIHGVSIAALPVMFALGAAMPAASLPLAVAWLGLDLGLLDRLHLARATGDLTALGHAPPTVARLAAADPRFRAMALRRGQFFSNDWIRWRARGIAGFHPAAPLRWADLRRTGLLGADPMMHALSIAWISGDIRGTEDTTRFAPLPSPADDRAWQVRGARPRAAAVTSVRAASSDEEALRMLAMFDPAREAITVDTAAAAVYPGSAACAIRWLADDPDRLALETDAPAPAFVVIADEWFPGWTATLDDRPLAIHRIDHLLRGVAVPAGRHRITMRYEPEGWGVSTRAAALAWLLWIAAAARVAWRARTRRAATASTA
jgi:hypothetical protein